CRSPCGALDLHVLSLPPAFVLSQDQTLKFRELELAFWSRMNRREHSHLAFDTEASKRNVTSLSKREPPKSLYGTFDPKVLSSASTLPPTFLFLQYSVFKERTPHTLCLGLSCSWLQPGRVSLTRLS